MTLVIQQNSLNTKFSVISQKNDTQNVEDSQQNLNNTDSLTSYSVDSRNIITNLTESFSSEELNSYTKNVDISNSLSLTNSFIVDLFEDSVLFSLNALTSQESFIVSSLPYFEPLLDNLFNFNADINNFKTKSIEKLIKSSQNALDKISILSHEKLIISKTKDRLDTNFLYLSTESIDNESFKNIIRSKYNKFESISDRLFNYINIENYQLLLKKSLKNTLEYVNILDDISTFSKKLEKDINYGNIVENFIKEGTSKYNSRILGLLTESDDLYIDSVASSDERLLIKQSNVLSTNITLRDLNRYYNNVLGFDLAEENPSFSNSIKNSIIKNTDTTIGQIMIMQGLSLFSLHPNDLVFNSSYLNSRSKINLNAFNKFPILQLTDFSSNIFEKNQEILSIQNNIFSTSIKYKNDFLLPIDTLDNSINIAKYIDKNLINDASNLLQRNSILGFSDGYNNKQIRLMVSNGDNEESLFELLLSNVSSYYSHMSPKFLTLPTRYFMSPAFDRINQVLFNRSVDPNVNPVLRTFSDVFDFNDFFGTIDNEIGNSSSNRASKIKDKIKENFLKDGRGAGVESNNDVVVLSGRTVEIFDNFLGTNLALMYGSAIDDNQRHSNYSNKIKLFYNYAGESQNRREFYKSKLDEYFTNKNGGQLKYFSTRYAYKWERGEDGYRTEPVRDEARDERDLFEVEEVFENYNTFLVNSDSTLDELEFNSDDVITNISQSLENYSLNERLNDIVLFNTSNSFLNQKELFDFSFVYNRSGLLSVNDSLKYIKHHNEKINFQKDLNVSSKDTDYAAVLFNKNSYFYASKLLDKVSSAISKTRFELGNEVIEKYLDFIKKARSKVIDGNKYILLYDKDKVNAIETFEESNFISENSFYKNNFADSFSNIKNTSSVFSEDLDFGDHLMTSEEYRNFLSSVYTKSFLRNRKSLIKKIIKDNIRIFKQFSYTDVKYFGFDKLMADVFLNEKAKPAIRRKITNMVAVNAILAIKKIDSEIGSLKNKPKLVDMEGKLSTTDENFIFSKDFKKMFSKEFVDEVIRGIFDPHVIKDQRNFVIRSLRSKIENSGALNFSSSGGLGGVTFKNIPGILSTFKFPLMTKNFELPNEFHIEHIDSLLDAGSVEANEMNMCKFANYLAYNYDIFIDEDLTGISYYEEITEPILSAGNQQIGENNFHGCAGYDFSGNKTTYGTDLKITYLDYEKPRLNAEIKLPYSENVVVIPFSYFYNSCVTNTFSYFITNLAKNIFEIFKCDLSEINTIQDAFDFLELNKNYSNILQDIFECYSYIFSTSYDNLINSNIFEICQNSALIENYDVSDGSFSFRNFTEKSVSDIEIIMDRYLKDDFKYQRDNKYSESIFLQSSENDIYTSRSKILQRVCSTLINSDLSESIGHDIMHGFFLNYEDNKENKENNLKSYNDSIEKIKDGISLLDINRDIINDYVLDEAYQNKVSKNLQEVIYYKNLYEETFINNTMYVSLEEKYKINDKFNHRKAHEDASYKHTIECLQQITSSLSENRTNKLDIIRIPITFDLVKKITTRGILKITILPVNVKYPEIEYRELSYFYSPMLANLTTQYSSIIDNTSNFIGIYNDTLKISERYCVVDKDTAVSEINFILTDIYNIKQELSQQTSLNRTRYLSNVIVNQNKLSHNIQQLNYVSQNAISENILAFDKDINNIISPEATRLFKNINENDLRKSFNLENIDLSTLIISDKYQDLGSNKNILKNQELYKKLMLNIDKDISETDLLKILLPTKNYDIFNILVNKNDLVPLEDSEITEYRGVPLISTAGRENVLHSVENENESDRTLNATKSFLYYIKIGVL